MKTWKKSKTKGCTNYNPQKKPLMEPINIQTGSITICKQEQQGCSNDESYLVLPKFICQFNYFHYFYILNIFRWLTRPGLTWREEPWSTTRARSGCSRSHRCPRSTKRTSSPWRSSTCSTPTTCGLVCPLWPGTYSLDPHFFKRRLIQIWRKKICTQIWQR